MDHERSVIAKIYKLKSQDSMAAARTCLEKRHFRSTCSRAYFAVMQIITAACYQLTDMTPKQKRINWKHDSVPNVFSDVMKRTKTYEGNQQLVDMVRQLLKERELVDYQAETEENVSGTDVAAAVLIAEKVRAFLVPLMGDMSEV